EASHDLEATVSVRVPSELGRKEFVLVSLVQGEDGLIAFPSTKGSGAVTAFSQSDGFIEIDALSPALDAGVRAQVTLIGDCGRVPGLVVGACHCVGLVAVLGALADRGVGVRPIAVGSMGGVAAARRGECDIAPVHLVDPASDIYNAHLVTPGLRL